MGYKKKRFRSKRRRKKKGSLWRKVRKLQGQISKVRKSISPWNWYLKTEASHLQLTENVLTWGDTRWGKREDWTDIINRLPFDRHTADTGIAVDGQIRSAADSNLVVPDVATNTDHDLWHLTIQLIQTIHLEIRNNEQFPIYLKVYRYVYKESTANSPQYATTTDILDRSVTNMEQYTHDTETLNKNNPAFKLSMLELNGKSSLFKDYIKIQKYDMVKIEPGVTVHIYQKNRMIMPYNTYASAFDLAEANAVLGGRAHGILLCARGCLGVNEHLTTNQFDPGFMSGSLQIAKFIKSKYRWMTTTLPPTLHWSDPSPAFHISGGAGTNLVAANMGETTLKAPQTG